MSSNRYFNYVAAKEEADRLTAKNGRRHTVVSVSGQGPVSQMYEVRVVPTTKEVKNRLYGRK